MSLEKLWKSRMQIKKEGEKEVARLPEEMAEDDSGPEVETDRQENIPEGLLSTGEFLKMYGQEAADEIYEWYADAISRRDREPLEDDRFRFHFFERGSHDPTYMYGDMKQGYLLGFVEKGAFIPTHFAPKSLRKGYELVQELGKSKDIPSVMMITADLVKTITKFPEWTSIDQKVLTSFSGEECYKIPVYNSHPDAKKALIEIAKEKLLESGDVDESLLEILKKASS
jgi:hypothetical protein